MRKDNVSLSAVSTVIRIGTSTQWVLNMKKMRDRKKMWNGSLFCKRNRFKPRPSTLLHQHIP
jgi:hypothetical protein